jgi:medium-chain acyl-[acyl-carrier-protein] hydrolase
MKIHAEQHIQVGEVSTDRKLRLDALFNHFQEMAVLHTQRVGLSLNAFLESGHTWVLSRAMVRIAELPRLDDTITLATWSRGIERFKGFREFELYRQGRRIIAASTLWIYLDARNGRPARVPHSYAERYGLIADQAVDGDIQAIRFADVDRTDYLLTVATRVSDYDVNGHVNNAVIVQYLQTALVRYFGEQVEIADISLMFVKEIPLSVNEVQVAVRQTTAGCLFAITGADLVFVKGTAAITDSSSR